MAAPRVAVAALALLTACGENQPILLPDGASAYLKPSVATAGHRRTWMDAGLKNQDLLYVANANGLVNVYRYQNHKLAGVLTNFQHPKGACADGAGNVYITDTGTQQIYEYAHGATKATRELSGSGDPYACSVDDKTGNLAVANAGARDADGDLEVFTHARGTPKIYTPTCDETHFFSVGYDAYGDLLAEATSSFSTDEYGGGFYYLQAKSKSLTCLDIPPPSSNRDWARAFAILWDGKYWVIDDRDLYRYSINITAKYVDKIALSAEGDVGPVAIYRKAENAYGTQLAGTSGYEPTTYSTGSPGYVNYWNYPTGGAPIYQSSSKDLDAPYGVAISLKQ
jgi:hypothetical protein